MATLLVSTLDDEQFDGGDLALEMADGGGLSLREALALAQDGDTITFDDGLADGSAMLANGQLTITQDDITIDGDLDDDGVADITIDANGASRVIEVSESGAGPNREITLDGLTVTGGYLSGVAARGAGVLVHDQVNLNIYNSRFTDNQAVGTSGNGGGIYAGTDSELVIRNTIFDHNVADEAGGAIANVGGILSIDNSSFTENYAGLSGGGIYSSDNGTASIQDTVFDQNQSGSSGGAFYFWDSAGKIANSLFRGNHAVQDGGVALVASYSDLEFTGSTFYANSAGNDGGAITAIGDATLQVNNNTFTGNVAGYYGDSIWLSGEMNAANNIFADGQSGVHSGIYVDDDGTFTTVGGNIFADPNHTDAFDIDATELAAIFNETIFNPYTGITSGRLRDNGGPVETVMINPNGPAASGGHHSALPTDILDLDGDMNTDEALPFDARGFNRVDHIVDIGAIELRLTASTTQGADILLADAFDDTIDGLAGNDTIAAGAGDDRVMGNDGADVLYGEQGDDTLNGQSGDDRLYGGDGADVLFGEQGRDTLRGNDGEDIIFGGYGKDRMYGGEGGDTLFGGANADIQFGDNGNDAFRGYGGNDRLFGGAGDDSLLGHTGTDIIHGDDDDDIVDGGEGDDQLFGDAGNDTLFGRDGNDLLEGGEGNDLLTGNKGADTLVGGLGDDTVIGNGGNDTFVFALGDGSDTIEAFTAGAGVALDVINLTGFGDAFDTFEEVLAAATDDGEGNTVIDFGGGDSITIMGTEKADLDTDDVIFA